MQINSKSDNDKFTLFPDGTLHLYDNLHEVAREEHTEYEGDLYIIRTELTQAEVEAQFDSLLEVERTKWRKHVAKADAEKAQKLLDGTDWVENQLSRTERLYGKESSEYLELLEKRRALLIQREAWVDTVRAGR